MFNNSTVPGTEKTAPALDALEALVAENRIDRVTTPQRIADDLRDLILSGRLAPGTLLKEVPLARGFKVSRNTFREALRILEYSGLATRSVHRGVVVRSVGDADVADLYRVRRVLELEAIARPDPDPARVEAVADAAEAYARTARTHELPAVLEADYAFHRNIVALLESPRLDDFFRVVFGELRIALSLDDRMRATLRRQAREHKAVARALAAGHVAEAAETLAAHLRTSERDVRTSLRVAARRSGATKPGAR